METYKKKNVHRVDDRYTPNPQSDQISFKKKTFSNFLIGGY